MPTRTALAHSASKITIRFYDAIRSKRAHDRLAITDAGFDELSGRKYALVVTFRTTGEPVPTPVWFGVADGRLYFRSVATGAKLRRIANRPDVLVAPCAANGRPTGAGVRGTAHILSDPVDCAAAEAALRGSYGMSRRLYMRLIATRVPGTYVGVNASESHG